MNFFALITHFWKKILEAVTLNHLKSLKYSTTTTKFLSAFLFLSSKVCVRNFNILYWREDTMALPHIDNTVAEERRCKCNSAMQLKR